MRIALADQPRVRQIQPLLRPGSSGQGGESLEAVVVDERGRPVEQVMGAAALRVWGDRATLRSDLPLLIGSRVQVQFGARNAMDAASKRLELQVIECRRKQGRHEVVARVIGAAASKALRKAA